MGRTNDVVFLILKAIRAILFHLFTMEVTIFICLYFPVFIDIDTFFSLSACLSFSLSFFHEANYVFIVLFLASQFLLFDLSDSEESAIFFYSYSVLPGCFSVLRITHLANILSCCLQTYSYTAEHFPTHFNSVSVSIDYSFQSSF